MPKLSLVGRCFHVVAAIAVTLPVTNNALAADAYRWFPNIATAQSSGDQQGETALAADSAGRVWLTFIDAQYHRIPSGLWIDWPRAVKLFVSVDGGRTFGDRPDLGEPAGDQALASDQRGRVFATYVQYSDAGTAHSRQQIVLRRLDQEQPANISCLPWDERTKHDQSSLLIGIDGSVHIVGADIAPFASRGELLYARSIDDGRTGIQGQRLGSLGELPQLLETPRALMIIGPDGFYTSQDHGVFFSEVRLRKFGQKLVRVDVSPDRTRVYVIGDSASGGLRLSVSEDGGETWSVALVGASDRAHAWRYPAIHVSESGRVHVVWMDDRTGSGALYHIYSDDFGAHFSPPTKITDAAFVFPADAPPPPPATQNGTWIGDYLSLTTVGDRVIVAWSDQRLGTPKSVVQTSVGSPR